MYLGWSSHVYPLSAADVAKAADYAGPAIDPKDLPDDEVVLLIRKGAPDALLRGRELAEAAAAKGGTVDARVVFAPTVAKWNLAYTIVRVLRNLRRFKGTGLYHVSPADLRQMGLERAHRTLEHPQKRGNSDRMAKMRQLAESLRTHGYDDSKPVTVMLCRTCGMEDSIRQGHHRVSACIELGIPRVTVQFSAAGALPRPVAKFVKLFLGRGHGQ